MAKRYFEDEEQAKHYAKFRPSPPDALIEYVISKTKKNDLALDIGCGSGQMTKLLAPFFKKVVGIDVSESQILSAKNSTNIPSNVEFKVGPSEVLNYEDETVDLITVCQAVHWFDIPKFYKEVDRVLKPNGVLAVIGYHTPNVCENIGMTLEQANHLNDLRNNFFFETLKSYWAPEVYMVTSSYDQLPIISYETIERCNHFFVDVEGTIEDMAGDILTWSGFNKFRQIKGDDEAMEKFEKFLEDTENFCNKNQKLTLRHRYFMILGCKSGK